MAYCPPPTDVPPAVIRLAEHYDYHCPMKYDPIMDLDYDVYKVRKFDIFIAFILVKDNEIRFANHEEAKRCDFFCGWGEHACDPFEINNNTMHYILNHNVHYLTK